MARKIAKDVKKGDKVYCCCVNQRPNTLSILDIQRYSDDGLIKIIYSNHCEGVCYEGDTSTGMGMYSASIFFDKEDAKDFYKRHSNTINSYIKKIDSL